MESTDSEGEQGEVERKRRFADVDVVLAVFPPKPGNI